MHLGGPLPIDAALPELTAALVAHNTIVLVAPPGAGKTAGGPARAGATSRGARQENHRARAAPDCCPSGSRAHGGDAPRERRRDRRISRGVRVGGGKREHIEG